MSRSGFYAWLKRPPSTREQRRALIGMAVEDAYSQFKKRYGAPRLTVELNAQGIPCSLNHVASLLRERGLRARNGKGFKYRPATEAMTNVNDNLLRRNFTTEGPNRKWVTDITYIRVGNSRYTAHLAPETHRAEVDLCQEGTRSTTRRARDHRFDIPHGEG